MSVNKVNQTTGELSPIAGGTFYADAPVGLIIPFGGNVIPSSFLLCDGQSILRTDYPELFAVIGTSFGSVDDTHFNVPDLRESTVKGAGLTGNSSNHMDADGLTVGEFLNDRIQNIVGTGGPQGWMASDTYQSGAITQKATGMVNLPSGGNVGSSTYVDFDASRIARTGDTTEVKSVGVNFIIKAIEIGLPTNFCNGIFKAPMIMGDNTIGNLKPYLDGGSWEYSFFVFDQDYIYIRYTNQDAYYNASTLTLYLGDTKVADIFTDATRHGGRIPCEYKYTIPSTNKFKIYTIKYTSTIQDGGLPLNQVEVSCNP